MHPALFPRPSGRGLKGWWIDIRASDLTKSRSSLARLSFSKLGALQAGFCFAPAIAFNLRAI